MFFVNNNTHRHFKVVQIELRHRDDANFDDDSLMLNIKLNENYQNLQEIL